MQGCPMDNHTRDPLYSERGQGLDYPWTEKKQDNFFQLGSSHYGNDTNE